VFPGLEIAGIDGSEAMLEFGRKYVREAGLDSRITLEKRYLPDASLENHQFDAAISNSLLHHLADPLTLWRAASRSVKHIGFSTSTCLPARSAARACGACDPALRTRTASRSAASISR